MVFILNQIKKILSLANSQKGLFIVSLLIFSILITIFIFNLIALKKQEILAASTPPCKGYGDVDLDGDVDENDALKVSRFVAGLETQLSREAQRRADVDGSGQIDNVDALKIVHYINNPDPSFPACRDHDGDGFITGIERYIGTDPYDACSNTSTANDEVIDAWPVDLDDNRTFNIIDVGILSTVFLQSVDERVDIIDGGIDVNENGVVGGEDDASIVLHLLSGGFASVSIINGRIDVNKSRSVGSDDDLVNIHLYLDPAPGSGSKQVDIIDGRVDVNESGDITTTDDLTNAQLGAFRFDLDASGGTISLVDVLAVKPFLNKTCTNSPAPTLSFTGNGSANPIITPGQKVTLSWNTQNALSPCDASNGWSGEKPTSGSETVSPSQTTTYNLTCYGPGGKVEKSVKVTVKAPVCPDQIKPLNLYKATGAPKVYVITNDCQKHWVTNPDAFNACKYDWAKIREVSSDLLNSLPSGANISGPPCLLVTQHLFNEKETGKVYVITDDYQKRWIINPNVFNTCQYDWLRIGESNKEILNLVTTGPDVTGPPCPAGPIKPPCSGKPSISISKTTDVRPGETIRAEGSGLSGCSNRDKLILEKWNWDTSRWETTSFYCTLDNGISCGVDFSFPIGYWAIHFALDKNSDGSFEDFSDFVYVDVKEPPPSPPPGIDPPYTCPFNCSISSYPYSNSHRARDIVCTDRRTDGQPVYSISKGEVIFVGDQDGTYSCGWEVKVRTITSGGDRYVFRYCHLYPFPPVTSGTQIEQGALLGYAGCTGTCYGSHLHLCAEKNGPETCYPASGTGQIDPKTIVPCL